MDEKVISYIKKYAISAVILGLGTWFILWLRDFSATESLQERYLHLADAFTIPGVIMLMVGVLVWVAGQGNFDMISYGLKTGIRSLIPTGQHTHETFYDYKLRKEKKRIKGYGFLFISGGIYLIPAIVFTILYSIAV